MIAPLPFMKVTFGLDITLIIIERDHPLPNREFKFAIRPVIILPTQMRVMKKLINKVFDGIGDT